MGLTYQNQGYRDRLDRAKSWVERAKKLQEQEWDDYHGPFIFYWIAFNALYGQHHEKPKNMDHKYIKNFLGKICKLDPKAVSEILADIKSDTDRLLKDKYLARSYWKEGRSNDFEKHINDASQEARTAYDQGKPAAYLTVLFERLQLLRNQIFHGCSTDRNSLNKESLQPALEILEKLVKQFLEIFEKHGKNEDWGKIPYPRKDSPQHRFR